MTSESLLRLRTEVPSEVRERCIRPGVPVGSLGRADLQVFTVQQEASLTTCEIRKDQGVGVADAINAGLERMAAELKAWEDRAGKRRGWPW